MSLCFLECSRNLFSLQNGFNKSTNWLISLCDPHFVCIITHVYTCGLIKVQVDYTRPLTITLMLHVVLLNIIPVHV